MVTWQQLYVKTQRLVKDSNADVLTQIKQDLNTGYHLFNAKNSRYFSRKQQFTDLVAGQQIYQVPIDCIRVMGITAQVTTNFQPSLKEIRSEEEWREIVAVPTQSNYPTFYFMLGSDALSLWPVPSQTVANGMRFYYQQQDHDLSIDDLTSTTLNATVTVTNGSQTVTASSGVFSFDMTTLSFQVTGIPDLNWYEIVASTATTLTLKSPYVGASAAAQAFKIGQLGILPQEYQEAPMHYALGNYFSANGNENRSMFHLGTIDKPGMFYQMVTDCLQEYSSSNVSSVITEDASFLNPWLLPPLPGT